MTNAAPPRFSNYDDDKKMQQMIQEVGHRSVIGGLWEELGSLQLEFLKSRGLRPEHTLIDVGAGSFRAGVKFVPYLDPGNYYAIDIQATLLETGYQHEIVTAGLDTRFPARNFAATASFDVSGFRRLFDFGVAQSVFTHMPIIRLNACLASLAPYFIPGGQFLATVFLAPDADADKPYKQLPGGVVTQPGQDPFHTTLTELAQVAARAVNWQMSVIGGWGHPRNQQMVCFTRR